MKKREKKYKFFSFSTIYYIHTYKYASCVYFFSGSYLFTAMAHSIPENERTRENGTIEKILEDTEDDKFEEEISEDDSQPPPPDGGWGWFVVLGSFMIHIVSE